jgi:hypothetical protein
MTFQDPEGENFYEINAYTVRTSTFPNQLGEEVTFVERYPLYLQPKNPAYERDYYVGGSLLIDDKLFDGKEVNIDLFTGGNYFADFENEQHYESMQVITEIHFELKSVTRSYYDFSTTNAFSIGTMGTLLPNLSGCIRISKTVMEF